MSSQTSEQSQPTFEELIESHLDGLYRLGYWISSDRQLAEDLVQEACLKACRHFDRFQRGGSFKAWISKILTNSYIDRYRRRKREAKTADFQEHEPPADEPARGDYEFDTGDIGGYHELVDDRVQAAILKVPEHFRTVFLLYGLGDFTYQEIADMLDIPIGTVMSRLFRARKILRQELTGYAREIRFPLEKPS